MELDPWVAITDATARDLSDLLDEFAHVRAASVCLFASLDNASWMHSGSLVSVRALAWTIAGHELHHNVSLRTPQYA